MLLHRAEGLRRACTAKQQQREIGLRVSALQQRLEELQGFGAKLSQASAVIELLWGRFDSEDLRDAVALAQNYGSVAARYKELSANPELLTDSADETYPNLHRQLSGLSDRILQHVRTAWTQYKSERMPGDHHDLLRAFSPTRLDVVSRLTQLRQRLRTEFGELPDERQLQLFDNNVAEYGRRFVELFGEETPKHILDALRLAASAEGAPLTDFDDDVRDWLQEREIETSFRVRTL